MKKKYILIFLLGLFSATSNLFSDFWFDLKARLSMSTNDRLISSDYYALKGNIEFDVFIFDNFEIALEAELNKYKVDVGELSFSWKAHPYLSILAGKFENSLSIEEYLPAFNRIFATKTIITDEINSQGYISNSIGISLYKKYKKNYLPISYYLHYIYIPSQLESQFDFGFFYHYKGKNSYLGFLACYYPFLNHKKWNLSEYYNLHNLLFDFVICDYSKSLQYCFELTLGSNLVNPIGQINYPVTTAHPMFLGGNFDIGYVFHFSNITWEPAFRSSILFPEVSRIRCNKINLIVGNAVCFFKRFKIHLDAGLGIITRYDSSVLTTRLTPRWGINLIAKR